MRRYAFFILFFILCVLSAQDTYSVNQVTRDTPGEKIIAIDVASSPVRERYKLDIAIMLDTSPYRQVVLYRLSNVVIWFDEKIDTPLFIANFTKRRPIMLVFKDWKQFEKYMPREFHNGCTFIQSLDNWQGIQH